jgi:hypothetical protein
LPGNGKESGKPLGKAPRKPSAVNHQAAQCADPVAKHDVAGLYYLLVDCFACGMSQPLDLVFYHQFPAL